MKIGVDAMRLESMVKFKLNLLMIPAWRLSNLFSCSEKIMQISRKS